MPEPQLTEKELQALLRLKRYEQPAPAYFDGLLKNVHRQQEVDRVAAGEEPVLAERDLQALLRLKRYEQPPPAYFDGLLGAIHRRQRDELMRPPVWRRVFTRLAAAFSGMGRDWSYVSTMAGVLLIGLGMIQWIMPMREFRPPTDVARAPLMEEGTYVVNEEKPIINLPLGNYHPVKAPAVSTRGHDLRSATPVRFVIDAQPASYEPTQIQF
jgi:hypothetical protein